MKQLLLGSAGLVVARRLGRRSGLTDAEVAMPLPGDDLIPNAVMVVDRGFDLGAVPAVVWPWLLQLGKRRAGWYFPRWVEVVVPADRRGLRRLDPAFLGLAVGDEIPDWGPRTPGGEPTFVAVVLEEPHTIVYRSDRPRKGKPPVTMSWALVLRPIGDVGTRVHLRLRIAGVSGRFTTLGGLFDLVTIVGLHHGLEERV